MSDCREIVIDTETTGLNPNTGDRIVEIGCVEIFNKKRTGNFFHKYVNPERDMPMEAFKIHGISAEFLKDKPLFRHIREELFNFIGTSNIIIHNAGFDLSFINKELSYTGHQGIHPGRVTDTLTIARRRYPGAPASLDALCRKFNVSLQTREKHGALIDAELLAQVYLLLTGNNQSTLNLGNTNTFGSTYTPKHRDHRPVVISDEMRNLHSKFTESKIKNSLWLKTANQS